MSPSRDDRDVIPSFDDRTADALLGGRAVDSEPELTSFVTDLTALAEQAPTPSAALAELLEHGLVGVAAPVVAPPAVRRRWTASPLWARAAAAGTLTVAAVISAAAANALPHPAQNAVAEVVGWVTPVHLPHAEHERGPAPVPSPSATRTPEPQPTRPTTGGAQEPGDGARSPRPTSGPDGSDDRSPGSDSGSVERSPGTGDAGDGSQGSGSGDSGSGGSHDATPTPTPSHGDDGSSTPSPDGH